LKGKWLHELNPALAVGALIATLHRRMPRLQADLIERPYHFRDRLGDRWLRKDASGDTVEVFRLCRELAAMRAAIRDRFARLATLRLAHFVPVRGVEVSPDDSRGFEIVSDYIPGTRLSEMLDAADAGRIAVSTDAALHVVRQLFGALAAFHESRAVTHGAIGPERLIVTPRGHVVIADCVLGLALARLGFSRTKLWRQFRIPMPPGAEVPVFDQRADIAQIGLVTLALLAGRPLKECEYPEQLLSLVDSLGVTDEGDACVPMPKVLRAWLRRVLPVETRSRFATARDAQIALEDALSKRRRTTSAENPLKALVDGYQRARIGGGGETGSTTGRVDSGREVDIPASRPLRPVADESRDMNLGGAGQNLGPAFMRPREAPVRRFVPEEVRADDSVIQPLAVPIRPQPWPAVVWPRDAAELEPVGLSQPTGRTALGASRWLARAVSGLGRTVSAAGRAVGVLGRAVSAAGGAVLFVSVRVARATARAARATGAITVHGLARVTRGTARAAQASGASMVHGLARAVSVIGAATVNGATRAASVLGRTVSAVGAVTLHGLVRVARETARAAHATGAGVVHGLARAVSVLGRTVSAAGGTLLFVAVRVARETARAAHATGAGVVHGLAHAVSVLGRTVSAAGRALLFVAVRVARATARAARGTTRAAHATGAGVVHGLAGAVSVLGRTATAVGAVILHVPLRVARATARAAHVIGAATVHGLARVARETARAALATGAATAHGLARAVSVLGRTLSVFGRAVSAVGAVTLHGLVRVARETARAAQATGAATAHGLARAVSVLGRTVSAVGRALLFVAVRVARATARAARATARAALATGATTVHGLARAARGTARAALATGATTVHGLARAARGTARAALATGAATAHVLACVARGMARAAHMAAAAAVLGSRRILRATGRAARTAGAVALGTGAYRFGSPAHVVGHVQYPLVRRPFLIGAVLVVVAVPGLQLTQTQWLGVLDAWIPVVESAAGKHILARVADVGSAGAGALRVQSQPTGAKVWLDGVLRGETPLALDRVKEGAHKVLLRDASGSVRTTVRVRAGETADVLVPIYSGWLAAFASAELQIVEGGVFVGTTESGRILIRPGDHVLELVSETLGFRTKRTIEVKPGEVAALNIELPPAPLEIVAPSGAELWIDGQPIGTAPVQPRSVAIGTREVVMRHPVLGEQRQTTTITYRTPNRIVFAPPS